MIDNNTNTIIYIFEELLQYLAGASDTICQEKSINTFQCQYYTSPCAMTICISTAASALGHNSVPNYRTGISGFLQELRAASNINVREQSDEFL